MKVDRLFKCLITSTSNEKYTYEMLTMARRICRRRYVIYPPSIILLYGGSHQKCTHIAIHNLFFFCSFSFPLHPLLLFTPFIHANSSCKWLNSISNNIRLLYVLSVTNSPDDLSSLFTQECPAASFGICKCILFFIFLKASCLRALSMKFLASFYI